MEQWPHICGAFSGPNAFPLLVGFSCSSFETRHTYTSHTATMIQVRKPSWFTAFVNVLGTKVPERSELTIVFKDFLCLPKE